VLFRSLPNDSQPDTLGAIVPGDGARTVTIDGVTNATDVIGFTYSDPAFNGGLDVGIVPASLTNNTMTIDQSDATTIFAADRLYVVDDGMRPVVSVCRSMPGASSVQFNSGDKLNINVNGASGTFSAITNAACRQIDWFVYYVDSTGTLRRRIFGAQADLVSAGMTPPSPYLGYIDMPLCFNVENFQVQYILDTGDLLDAIPTQTDWERIRLIRVTITVRSPEADRKTGQPIRETLTGVYFARNLANQERPPVT